MRVTVETTTGLERKATVAVPSESFEADVAENLRKRAATLKLPGFRPGRVPMKEVRRRFGSAARAEVAQTVVNSSFADVVTERDLAVVGAPQVEVVNAQAGNDFEYTATFEVLPTFELQPLSTLRIRKPAVEITETDVDNTIEVLRRQRTNWEAVERPAQKDDRVTVDYTVKVDGEVAMDGEDEPLIAGGDHRIVDLPATVLGMAIGETRTFPVTVAQFGPRADAKPEDAVGAADDDTAGADAAAAEDAAMAEDDATTEAASEEAVAEASDAAAEAGTDTDVATETTISTASDGATAAEAAPGVPAAIDGDPAPADTANAQDDEQDRPYIEKDGIGEVSLRRVEEPHLPPVDDSFFDILGIDPGPDRHDRFRTQVRAQMQTELDRALKRCQRDEIAKVINETHDFDLPNALVQAELIGRLRRMSRAFDLERLPASVAEVMRADAAEAVRLALVLGEVARLANISADQERIKASIEAMAAEFEDPASATEALYSQENLEQVANAVLEQQAIDHLLAQADLTEVPASYGDAIVGQALPPRPKPQPADESQAELQADAADEAEPVGQAEPAGDAEPTPSDTPHPAAEAPKPKGFAGRFRRLLGRAK